MQNGRLWLVGACLWAVLGTGCAGMGYVGAARDLPPDALRSERGWLAVQGVPFVRQHGEHDCGPAALEMVQRYWYPDRPPASGDDSGRRASAAELRELARRRGLDAFIIEGGFDDIQHELARQRPLIVGLGKPTLQGRVAHYEVIVGIHLEARRIATLDPARGLRQNTLEGFAHEWLAAGRLLIVALPAGSEQRATGDAVGAQRVAAGLAVIGPEERALAAHALGFGRDGDALVVDVGHRARPVEADDDHEVAQGARDRIGVEGEHAGAVAEIRFEISKEPRSITICVRDTGVGIAEHQLERIFEPFAHLEREGYRVTTSASPFGATRLIREAMPDLVLLDVNMPALSGDGLADVLSRNDRVAAIPILFYSSNDADSLRAMAASHGVAGWICKGDPAELLRKVREHTR